MMRRGNGFGTGRVVDKLRNRISYWLGKGKRGKREIKDILFRMIYEEDHEALLELYNALNNSAYKDINDLVIVTLDDSIYINVKNDLAFILHGTINMYEHQSTFNPNMPVRMFIYLADEYQKILKTMDQSIYGESLIKLPTPACIVFYNGTGAEPDEQILKLSDAFIKRQELTHTELEVKILNINYGHNEELMERCKVLREYSECIQTVREFTSRMDDKEKAIADAIDYCISQNILRDFLMRKRNEVLGAFVDEFEIEKYERGIENKGFAKGEQAGFARGMNAGARSEKILFAKKCLERGKLSVEEIAEDTGLDVEEVIQLQNHDI